MRFNEEEERKHQHKRLPWWMQKRDDKAKCINITRFITKKAEVADWKWLCQGGWVLVHPRWQRCFQRCTSRGTSQIIEVRIVQFHSNVQNQIKNKSRLIRTNKVRVMQGVQSKDWGRHGFQSGRINFTWCTYPSTLMPCASLHHHSSPSTL